MIKIEQVEARKHQLETLRDQQVYRIYEQEKTLDDMRENLQGILGAIIDCDYWLNELAASAGEPDQ